MSHALGLAEVLGDHPVVHWAPQSQLNERLHHPRRQVAHLDYVDQALLLKSEFFLVGGSLLEESLAMLVLIVALKHLVLSFNLAVAEFLDDINVLVGELFERDMAILVLIEVRHDLLGQLARLVLVHQVLVDEVVHDLVGIQVPRVVSVQDLEYVS